MAEATQPVRKHCPEQILFLGLLAWTLYVVYYRDFTHMGLYEDDWSAMAPYANGDWSLAWGSISSWLTHWPNGRPLGLGTCALAGWGLFHLGGLAALYLLPYCSVLACSWTIFRILCDHVGTAAAFIGALAFTLLPTDTLRLSLHGAPHLYLAVFFMLLAIRALQLRREWLVAPVTFFGLLFHESATLTIFLGPFLFLSFTRDFFQRALRHWAYASLGLLAVFLCRVFVFAETRATSTFTSLPQVLERSLISLKTGTLTHWSLLAQRGREAWQFPLPGSACAFATILGVCALVVIWKWTESSSLRRQRRESTLPWRQLLFGALAMSVPYLLYFTDPYWPANHVAGRVASVHSASGVGFAFLVAGAVRLLQFIPWTSLQALATTALLLPLVATLSWGNVIRSQHLDAWENQRTLWTTLLGQLGHIQPNTVIFVEWESQTALPFTWVIGSSSWSDSIVLSRIYAFPPLRERHPRVFRITGSWQQAARAREGKIYWDMPAGDWSPETIELEPGNVMLFKMRDGRPVPQRSNVELNGVTLPLMEPTLNQPPAFPPTPLFPSLIKASH